MKKRKNKSKRNGKTNSDKNRIRTAVDQSDKTTLETSVVFNLIKTTIIAPHRVPINPAKDIEPQTFSTFILFSFRIGMFTVRYN
jgi:hypothetical protein